MAAPKKYPDELKARAVRLYLESDPSRRSASWPSSWVHHEALRNWIRQADTGQRPAPEVSDLAEENKRLRKEVAELERVNDNLAFCECVFRLGARPDPEVIVGFVEDSPHPVELVLRVLGIASSAYYWWRERSVRPSARQVADEQLLAEIVDIHTSSGGTYGSPRVHAMLARRGVAVGRKRVERVMRGAGLQGAFLRKRWRIASTRPDPRAAPAPDLVERVFTADRPNRLWVADATRIPCGQGAFWLAAVRDAFSNRIVGWKTSDRCDTELVLGASSTRSGAVTFVTAGWSTTATAARPTQRSGSLTDRPTTESRNRWDRSVTAMTTL
ncbi:IS3 family transposase [Nocardia sp. NPDC057353]|uniref:IS3 family transposase n=1 Tax=Nocardia sp. NPDC057353 TaxID=3346104 RepID=UPI003637780F